MAQPKPHFSDQSYPDSTRERRTPLPITHLPVNALSGDTDPTRDLRALIEQLQQSARDARAQVRIAETERDDMAAQVGHFRQQNEELRARFIEITSIIRDRDAALEEVERMSRTLADAQLRLTHSTREIIEAQSQRDEAVQQRTEMLAQRNESIAQQALLAQQRDELNRKLEAASLAHQEASRRQAEMQKQLLAIREARDAAQARNGEQSRKLTKQEEEIVALRDELEMARQSSAGAISKERWSAAAAEREQALAEAERLRGELEALLREHQAAQERVEAVAAELRAEREQVLAEAERLRGELEASHREHQAAQERAEAMAAELRAERENASGMAAREAAVASLTAAQQKIERLIRDRDSIRQQSMESIRAQESQMEALRAQLAIFEATNPEAAQHTEEIRDLARRLAYTDEERRELVRRLERQREETVDLATQLRAAQDQIRQMSASLAEARLQGRGAAKAAASAVPAVSAVAELPAPIFDGGEAVAAMRQAYDSFARNPRETAPFREIAAHAQAYAERAGSSRIAALEHLGLALGELALDLCEYPDRTTPEILRTVQQTIEFLATLATVQNLSAAKDPASARVLTVDDEVECCEVVCRVMETATIQATHAEDSAKALAELAAQQYDLIFLDVNMPGINGFELCAQIRSLSVNSRTPVIFLTGLSSAENRLQSTMSGGNEFISKPFLFPELTVKALTLMLKAQFHIA